MNNSEDKWLVVYTLNNNIFLRNDSMQKNFLKFTEKIQKFMEDELKREMTKYYSSRKPEIGDHYILMSNNKPFRVILKKEYSNRPETQSLDAEVMWRVYYLDFGKCEVVKYSDLIKLTHSSFFYHGPMMKSCTLNNVDFKNIPWDQSLRIDAWIKEQLLNKSFAMTFKNIKSKFGKTKTYVNIFLDNNLNFRNILTEEFPITNYFENRNQPQHSGTMKPQMQCSVSDDSASGWSQERSWTNQISGSNYTDFVARPNSSFVPASHYHPGPYSLNDSYASIPYSNPAASISNFKTGGTDEDNERKVAELEGRLKAYKEELKRKEKSSFTDDLKKIYNQIANIMSKKKEIHHFRSNDSPLSRAVSMLLLDSTLLSHLQDAAIKGKEIRESSLKNKVDIFLVNQFKNILNPLKLPDKLNYLGILISELEELKLMLNIASDFRSRRKIDDKPEIEGLCVEFNVLKKDYESLYLSTDLSVTRYNYFLENYNQSISNVIKGIHLDGSSNTDFLEVKHICDAIASAETEYTKMKNCERIEIILDSVLEEVEKRRKKIMEVECQRKLIESLSLETEDTLGFHSDIEKDEQNLGTLLNFVMISKKMAPSFKYIIVEDIFKELLQNHQKNKIYFYVNPANILINSGATLSLLNVTLNEPIPPFQFLAPECRSIQPDILTLYRGKDYDNFHIEDSVVGLAADCYSLGQLIQWIFCADAGENDFIEQMIHVKESQPILRKLLDPSPKERPSLEELNEKGIFKELLKNIFGEYDVPEKKDQDFKSEIKEESAVEALPSIVPPEEDKGEKNVQESLPCVDKQICQGPATLESSHDLLTFDESPDVEAGNFPKVYSDISLLPDKIDVVKNDEDDILMDLSDPSITNELAILSDESSCDEV